MSAEVPAYTSPRKWPTIPLHVIQMHVLPYFSSLEVFKLRLVNTDWAEAVKLSWCHSAKGEMMNHVHSLDLLYEKETVSKLLDLKLGYVMACGELMQHYFVQLPLHDLFDVLLATDLRCAKELLVAVVILLNPAAVALQVLTLIFTGLDALSARTANRRAYRTGCGILPDANLRRSLRQLVQARFDSAWCPARPLRRSQAALPRRNRPRSSRSVRAVPGRNSCRRFASFTRFVLSWIETQCEFSVSKLDRMISSQPNA